MNRAWEFVQSPLFFPCVILLLYACCSVRWFIARDVGQGVYWIAAFLITFSVTFLMKH